MALTVAIVREHIETDLSDAALQRLIDAAEDDLGSDTAVVETFIGLGRRTIFLRRPASLISSVVEHASDGDVTLTASDHRLFEGRMLERLETGTNPATYWEEKTTVTYVPNDLRRRTAAALDLVRLEAERRGVSSEGTGDYRMTALDNENERRKILASFFKDFVA
jgi:hypothetical protein